MADRHEGAYTVKELADRGDVTPRTVYYYVSEGLLLPPRGGGPAATYGDDHLARLRLIRRLKEQYLPLAEIRARMAGLSSGEVEALLDERPTPPEEGAREYLARVLGDARAVPPARAPAPATASLAPASRSRGGLDPWSGHPEPAGAAPPEAPAPAPDSAADSEGVAQPAPIDGVDWRRVSIRPDLELHVRRDAPPWVREKLRGIVESIRRVLEP